MKDKLIKNFSPPKSYIRLYFEKFTSDQNISQHLQRLYLQELDEVRKGKKKTLKIVNF